MIPLKEKEKIPESQISDVKVRDGKVWCRHKGALIDICNPDDLFKVNIDQPDLKTLGLPPPMI